MDQLFLGDFDISDNNVLLSEISKATTTTTTTATATIQQKQRNINY
jgi:hypothetical protein